MFVLARAFFVFLQLRAMYKFGIALYVFCIGNWRCHCCITNNWHCSPFTLLLSWILPRDTERITYRILLGALFVVLGLITISVSKLFLPSFYASLRCNPLTCMRLGIIAIGVLPFVPWKENLVKQNSHQEKGNSHY
jgi:hypothetical protein